MLYNNGTEENLKKHVLGNSEGAYLIFKQRHSPQVTESLAESTKFDSKKDAEKRLTCIPKKLGRDWKAIPVETLIDNYVEPNATYSNSNLKDIYADITMQLESLKQFMGDRQYLKNAYKTISLMENDIQHLIEFNTYNAADGYIIYKIYHELRVERRKIKNKLFYIDYLETARVTDLFSLKKEINKHYTYDIRTSTIMPLFKKRNFSIEDCQKVCENIRRLA